MDKARQYSKRTRPPNRGRSPAEKDRGTTPVGPTAWPIEVKDEVGYNRGIRLLAKGPAAVP